MKIPVTRRQPRDDGGGDLAAAPEDSASLTKHCQKACHSDTALSCLLAQLLQQRVHLLVHMCPQSRDPSAAAALADPACKRSPASRGTDVSGSHDRQLEVACAVFKGRVAANVPCGLRQQQPSAPAASSPLPPPWSTSSPSHPPCPCNL